MRNFFSLVTTRVNGLHARRDLRPHRTSHGGRAGNTITILSVYSCNAIFKRTVCNDVIYVK